MIDELLNEVHSEHCRQIRIYGLERDFKPMISVYITEQAYHEIIGGIPGEVSSRVYEFFDKQTALGFPVYRVIGEKRHAPWKVVCEVKK